jgi:hypothetical protein
VRLTIETKWNNKIEKNWKCEISLLWRHLKRHCRTDPIHVTHQSTRIFKTILNLCHLCHVYFKIVKKITKNLKKVTFLSRLSHLCHATKLKSLSTLCFLITKILAPNRALWSVCKWRYRAYTQTHTHTDTRTRIFLWLFRVQGPQKIFIFAWIQYFGSLCEPK